MSGWLTSGPKVREFEQLFAERHGVKHALAVTSATTALHLALVALDIKEGDEVIVPAFTWVSTANVVLYCGATVVFADVDPQTFNIDPTDLKVTYKPYSEDDARALVQNRIGSRVKAEKELGFLYKYSLKEGLQKLIDWRIDTGIDKLK